MVNVTKGILVTCDPAMKQLLLNLDEKLTLGTRFIIQVRVGQTYVEDFSKTIIQPSPLFSRLFSLGKHRRYSFLIPFISEL